MTALTRPQTTEVNLLTRHLRWPMGEHHLEPHKIRHFKFLYSLVQSCKHTSVSHGSSQPFASHGQTSCLGTTEQADVLSENRSKPYYFVALPQRSIQR